MTSTASAIEQNANNSLTFEGLDSAVLARAKDYLKNPHQYPTLKSKKHKFSSKAGRYLLDGVRYASRSEAACATLLKRYLPDFEIVEGETFQVPIGRSVEGHMRHVDFKITDKIFLEFHAPRFWFTNKSHGDFKDRKEAAKYRRQRRRTDPADRKAFKEKTKDKLQKNYYNKRIQQIKSNPEHQDAKLIVVRSADQLYRDVLMKYAPESCMQHNLSKADCAKQFKAEMSRCIDLKPQLKGAKIRKHARRDMKRSA